VYTRSKVIRTATRFGSAPTSGFVPAVGRRTSAAAGFLTQTLVNDLPQQIVVGPGQVLDLGYQLRPHPMHAAEHQGESRSGWCAVAERRAAFCVLFEPQAPRFLCDVAGADRVVLGSDYPFPIGDPEPARVVCDKPLTAAERRAILGETAARIFHIDCSCIDDC
jgi:hypothetical protein